MNPIAKFEVIQIENVWYLRVFSDDVNFDDKEAMPERFSSMNETQAKYWSNKIFKKLEARFKRHMNSIKMLKHEQRLRSKSASK